MTETRPIASLSLDLDDKWSYMKTHGDPGWQELPSYLDVVVPRVLGLLKTAELRLTVFVVGLDAAEERNGDLLRSIGKAGHEIGNHSYYHEPWLHEYSAADIETEIVRAEEAIEQATGQRPIGFRGPGYSISREILRVLKNRGYLYDASAFPSSIGILVRSYYFKTGRFTREQRRRLRLMGGAIGPLKPHRWQIDSGTLIEMPVTTMPLLRTPIHLSFLMSLRRLSTGLASRYLGLALRLCRLTGTGPSFLLHPTDFLGCDDTTDLAYVPAMDLPRDAKLEFATDVLRRLAREFDVVTVAEHARAIGASSELSILQPRVHVGR